MSNPQSEHDIVKLIVLSNAIGKIELPELRTEKGKIIVQNVDNLLKKVTAYISEKSATI